MIWIALGTVFAAGVAVGHYGPKAVVAWFGKQATTVKNNLPSVTGTAAGPDTAPK